MGERSVSLWLMGYMVDVIHHWTEWTEQKQHVIYKYSTRELKILTLSSHASSRISRASEEIALFLSCSWVTSNSIPQLLKNSTLALSSTLKCFVAYNLQLYKVGEKQINRNGHVRTHTDTKQQTFISPWNQWQTKITPSFEANCAP